MIRGLRNPTPIRQKRFQKDLRRCAGLRDWGPGFSKALGHDGWSSLRAQAQGLEGSPRPN